VVLDKLKQKLSATVPCSGSLSSSPPVDWDSPTARRSIRTVFNESVDGKTKKLLSRLTCELLSTISHLTLAKLEEKRAFDALRVAQKKHKRSKKLMGEFRASEDRGVVVFTSSKVRKLLDLQKAREQAKEQQKVDKALKAQQIVAAKELKARETQKREDDRLAASAARKKAAAERKPQGRLQGMP
jgi:1-deoxy-D-xylulose 5-phosphate reductoisomerase